MYSGAREHGGFELFEPTRAVDCRFPFGEQPRIQRCIWSFFTLISDIPNRKVVARAVVTDAPWKLERGGSCREPYETDTQGVKTCFSEESLDAAKRPVCIMISFWEARQRNQECPKCLRLSSIIDDTRREGVGTKYVFSHADSRTFHALVLKALIKR